MRDLFARVARPLAAPDTPGSWLAGRRLVAVDGTSLDLADTPANEESFGRPGSGRGERRVRYRAVVEEERQAAAAAADIKADDVRHPVENDVQHTSQDGSDTKEQDRAAMNGRGGLRRRGRPGRPRIPFHRLRGLPLVPRHRLVPRLQASEPVAPVI